jgi:hypothetical protein
MMHNHSNCFVYVLLMQGNYLKRIRAELPNANKIPNARVLPKMPKEITERK